MTKKIIQLSTKQCPPCQRLRSEIERVIDKTPYTYEYISLYNGPEMYEPEFDIEDYWVEVNNNITKYRKDFGVFFTSFPTIIKQEEDTKTLIPKQEIVKFLIDESK